MYQQFLYQQYCQCNELQPNNQHHPYVPNNEVYRSLPYNSYNLAYQHQPSAPYNGIYRPLLYNSDSQVNQQLTRYRTRNFALSAQTFHRLDGEQCNQQPPYPPLQLVNSDFRHQRTIQHQISLQSESMVRPNTLSSLVLVFKMPSESATEFFPFLRLPTELRVKIWGYAIENTNNQITMGSRWIDDRRGGGYINCDFNLHFELPAIFRVNQESRYEALKDYEKITIRSSILPRNIQYQIYINFDRDYFLFKDCQAFQDFFSKEIVKKQVGQRIRYLGIQGFFDVQTEDLLSMFWRLDTFCVDEVAQGDFRMRGHQNTFTWGQAHQHYLESLWQEEAKIEGVEMKLPSIILMPVDPQLVIKAERYPILGGL